MQKYEVIIVPDNPMVAIAYPPRIIVESLSLDQVNVWFKEAQEQGGYVGCHVHAVNKME